MAPLVRIVVLNFNAGELLGPCLRSLVELDWPTDRREIVVVDNGSSDGSDEIALSMPAVRLTRNQRGNTGFSANNLAMADLDGVDYVALVNPDSRVAPDWLAHLVEALAGDAGLGAACPRILLDGGFAELVVDAPHRLVVTGARVTGSPATFHVAGGAPLPGEESTLWLAPGGSTIRVAAPAECDEVELELCAARRVRASVGGEPVEVDSTPTWRAVHVSDERVAVLQHAGSFRLRNGNAGDIGWLERNGQRWDEAGDVPGWCGASVLLRSAYLADVGLFDESFFLYYEDTDMSWRGEKRGWRYRYVPEALAWHHQSATIGVASPLGIHHQWRNRRSLVRKHASTCRLVVTGARAAVRLSVDVGRCVWARPRALRRSLRRLMVARLRRSGDPRRRSSPDR